MKQERDRIYSLPEMSEEDGIKVAELEMEFAEMDGYTAESRAGELLLGVGIPLEQHFGLMSEIAPGFKLRVLLAQALFSDPDVLLLDEPTNNLDIDTIRWLQEMLNQRNSTMIIISHDRYFLNSVCTHMADLDYGELRVYPGNYDEYMMAATQARERLLSDNAKKKHRLPSCRALWRDSLLTHLKLSKRLLVLSKLTRSNLMKLKHLAASIRSFVLSKRRNCSVMRWLLKSSLKASMNTRCLAISI